VTGYTREQAALWTAATGLADRGFRIAMVQLGWNAATGEKTLLRPPPKDWQNADPFPSTQVKSAIDVGANAYLWRLPEGWWVVDADTAELTAEYTGLLGPPDVVTPRGAHWVVDAPAKRLHKLDTGVRAFYGPGSFYPGPDGPLREYGGQVPAAPRSLPVQLKRPGLEFGPVTPGQPTAMTPEAAAFSVARARDEWLASVKGGRHETLIRYLAVLTRYRLAQGVALAELPGELEAAALEHPDAVAGEEFETVDSAIEWAVNQARTTPWVLEAARPDTFDGRFAAPDPGEAPVPADVGDGGELFAPGDDEFYDNPPPPPEPVYGSFGGKLPLFYDTGVHWLQGESESGKSWVGFEVVREVLSSGGWAFVVDHEDTRGSVLRRFKALGLTREEYRRLVYVSGPDVTHAELRAHLATTERDYAVMLVDGVTSALDTAGLSGRDEQELTRWVDQLPRQARMSICIDHVVKATDDRQGMAIGSQAKKAVVTGSAWEVVCTSAFGRGRDGRIELRPQKDKGGFLRGELGRTAVRLEFKSGDGGDRVRIEAAAAAGFFGDPDDALFAALFADGVDGGIGSNELAREAKQRGAGYSTNRKADKHRAWLAYYSERMAVTESRSVSGLP
jgi:hypothetical protein